jgi:hypothetical protein
MHDREEYRARVKAAHAVPCAEVQMASGGYVYLRRPSAEEYDTFQSLAQGDGEEKRIAFARYVKACFVGAISAEGEELQFERVQELEGPAFVSGGACGHAVNRLSGAGERPTQLF